MIYTRPVSLEQLQAKQILSTQTFQDDLDRGFDYLLTDLLSRIAELERKEAPQNERGNSD